MNKIFLPSLNKDDYETTSEYVSSEEKSKDNKNIIIIKNVQPKTETIKVNKPKIIINKRTL